MPTESEAGRYVEEAVAAYPSIREVWLFGSRANGTARPDSDWDYLAFADWPTLGALRSDARFNREGVDLLIVVDGVRYEKPWPDRRGIKYGTLADDIGGLRWKQLTPTTATYTATKQVGASWWEMAVLPNQTARRVYPYARA